MPRLACRGWLLLLLVPGLLWAMGPRDVGAAPIPDHLGARCASCHLAGSEVTPENARMLTTTQERMCGRCHQGSVEAGHPTGFVPDRPLPAEFPLDWKGEVTCSTCHEVHVDPARPSARAAAGRELCAACHPAAFFARMADRGRSIMRSGHLDARARRPAQRIDSYSLQCAECHADYLSAPGEVVRVAFTVSNGTGMRNHPVGGDAARADFGGGLRARAALSGPVLAPDGRVSCLTCHRGYSQRHGDLAARRQTDLCLACHDK